MCKVGKFRQSGWKKCWRKFEQLFTQSKQPAFDASLGRNQDKKNFSPTPTLKHMWQFKRMYICIFYFLFLQWLHHQKHNNFKDNLMQLLEIWRNISSPIAERSLTNIPSETNHLVQVLIWGRGLTCWLTLARSYTNVHNVRQRAHRCAECNQEIRSSCTWCAGFIYLTK